MNDSFHVYIKYRNCIPGISISFLVSRYRIELDSRSVFQHWPVLQVNTWYPSLFYLLILFIMFALLLPSSLLVVTQIRGHIAGSSPPSPPRLVPFTFFSLFLAGRLLPFLPSSTRVELRLPTLYALSAVHPFLIFLQINSKSHTGQLRTPGPTRSISLTAIVIMTHDAR